MRRGSAVDANIDILFSLVFYALFAYCYMVGVPFFTPFSFLMGYGLFIAGCMYYAHGKGYPPAVGLVGITGLLGLIILSVLPDKFPGGIESHT